MKKILGLDLGTTSIGWALVNEAEHSEEKSSIIRLGVRVNPLTVDEAQNFEKGKSIETNSARTLKRGMRRNLQRYKLRRQALIKLLKSHHLITDETILSENGNATTFETYRLRAKAATEEITLEEFSRVLLMINKKRGYKSNRKAKGEEDGKLIDGMEVAKRLYDEGITPGQLCSDLLREGKKALPDFYRSDLQEEFDKVWACQSVYYPEVLTDAVKEELKGKNKSQTWAILAKHFVWEETKTTWDEENAQSEILTERMMLKGLKREKKGFEQKIENYEWRAKAVHEKMHPEELAIVLQEINNDINSSSGYLGAISDRSKSLHFNHLTVGQALMKSLDENPNVSLKNTVFYRQDYLDEFETIWEKQAEFHPELTRALKQEVRDTAIFYQRRLKSQKGLISYCEFERKNLEITENGQTKTIVIGSRVIPRSSPLFQEFKIWQTLNNAEVLVVDAKPKKRKTSTKKQVQEGEVPQTENWREAGKRKLTQEEKKRLAEELSIREKLSKTQVLKLLSEDSAGLDLNFKEISGNKTLHNLYKAYSEILEYSGHEPIDFKQDAATIKEQVRAIFEALGWNSEILTYNSEDKPFAQDVYALWHLLYSFESDSTPTGDGKLIEKLQKICNFEKEYARILANVAFESDYGSLSAKAIGKILPHLKKGLQYDKACEKAGYRHSAASLNKEEIANKELKEHLDLLSKNSLRNPVVEKILNQMVNVVNEIINTYGKPDEIRVELARDLKKNQKEREELSRAIASATKEQEQIRKILSEEFGITYPTRNDVIRYRLYEELKDNGYKTPYSDTYIPREKLFSKEYDIEHIIPKARLFDDSFSNKTLEVRSINIEKGNKTAYDFVLEKYGEDGLKRYLNVCESLFKDKKGKLRKLKMREEDIPEDFVDRDLRNTQYIAKRALSMLGDICRRVVATTGSITDQLRNDWQLVDTMKELNWEKYKAQNLVEYHTNHDGKVIGRIKDWTKRNDHRHHAMDALTVAFTKDVFIQYYNNKNASDKVNSNEYLIRNKYFKDGKAIAPIPLGTFRAEAKKHLEDILISIKAKNKVVTNNVNKTESKKGGHAKVQQTPRGELYEATIHGSHKEYATKEEKVNAAFDEVKIDSVCNQAYREALLKRLQQFDGDAKKAFTGKNALDKNPIWLNKEKGICVPLKVKTYTLETVYTIRKAITDKLDIKKVVDRKIRRILQERIKEFGDAKKAFSNLEENPIWLNKEKGICIKHVSIYKDLKNPEPIHYKRNKEGQYIKDAGGNYIPVDFVRTGNNHHVAIYRKPLLDKNGLPKLDEQGNTLYTIDEDTVTFYKAVTRANQKQPIVDKNYNSGDGWEFLYTMKQNEYFVFPNEVTGFDPKEVDLLNPENYALISPNLFRVQIISHKDYTFRHHLETTINDLKELKGITWKRITSLSIMDKIVKVRVNHIGQIVAVGEY